MWTTLCAVDSRGRVIQLNLIHLVALQLQSASFVWVCRFCSTKVRLLGFGWQYKIERELRVIMFVH